VNGIRINCPSLDCVGWYGQAPADLALMASVYELPGAEDVSVVTPADLRIGICRSPVWERADSAAANALEEAAARLSKTGIKISSLELPESFHTLPSAVATMMRGDARVAFLQEYRADKEGLHQDFRTDVENQRQITPGDLTRAYEAMMFEEGHGDPVFNVIWSALHAPVINLPGLTGPRGLPAGISLVGPRYSDSRLLAVAEALAAVIDVA
jgi:Asp-tRNA(Asn)/Glu-tRNA(Gln) amidotransferase A subunit family amidase